jgi:hypothetical protein
VYALSAVVFSASAVRSCATTRLRSCASSLAPGPPQFAAPHFATC